MVFIMKKKFKLCPDIFPCVGDTLSLNQTTKIPVIDNFYNTDILRLYF